ncbi:MAG: NFACT family protein [Fusobacteria bacterium]|nr:NFACT family protein [Fusobacteriota bacterium]
MFYLDGILLSKYTRFLNDKLKDRKISQITQYDLRNFFITFKNVNLHISLSPEFPILYLKEAKSALKIETAFLLNLKKQLTGAIVDSVSQYHFDRILEFSLTRLNVVGVVEKFHLHFEMISKNPNLVLLNEERKIIALFKSTSFEEQNDRVLLSNFKYTYPKRGGKLSPFDVTSSQFNNFSKEGSIISTIEGIGKIGALHCNSFETFQNYINSPLVGYFSREKKFASLYPFSQEENSEYEIENLFDIYFSTIQNEDSVEQSRQNYTKLIRTLIKKQHKIVTNIEKDLQNLQNLDRDKEIADILAANVYQLKSYSSQVTLYDFYQNKDIDIQLDTKHTIQRNIEKYYKIYNKKNRAIISLNSRLQEIFQNIEHLESISLSIEMVSNLCELQDIQKELQTLGLVAVQKAKGKKTKEHTVSVISEPYENCMIYIGKNNLANEKVTFQLARKLDLWFHVQNVPSAHVILSSTDGQSFSNEAILRAAKRCKYFSKAKDSLNVSVDYTEKKNVRKQKNYKPCLVFYTDFSTVIV